MCALWSSLSFHLTVDTLLYACFMENNFKHDSKDVIYLSMTMVIVVLCCAVLCIVFEKFNVLHFVKVVGGDNSGVGIHYG